MPHIAITTVLTSAVCCLQPYLSLWATATTPFCSIVPQTYNISTFWYALRKGVFKTVDVAMAKTAYNIKKSGRIAVTTNLKRVLKVDAIAVTKQRNILTKDTTSSDIESILKSCSVRKRS